MASKLSPRAREIVEALLQGKSLNELVPHNDPVRLEVERHLATALEKGLTADESAEGGESKPASESSGTKVAQRVQLGTSSPTGAAVVFSDGASRGNPGPAAVGVRICTVEGEDLLTFGEAIGHATNNVAEYRGAISAVTKALELGLSQVELRMDSELIVKQLKGIYRVKDPNLAELKRELDGLIARLDAFDVKHVPRAQNAVADQLANEALDALE